LDLRSVLLTVLIGAGIGILGRLVLPGRQPIGFILTVLIGVGAAFAGSWISDQFDFDAGPGVDWIELGIQVGVAAVGVGIAAALLPEPRRERRKSRSSRRRERD
jgi:uncharacterized membrane protein YeaQ/YmgE (transglycosylase-associated protein family)